MSCNECDDGGGECVYPYYGLAPHSHDFSGNEWVTLIKSKLAWPDNFDEDPEARGCGIYTHCLSCGLPDQLEDKI